MNVGELKEELKKYDDHVEIYVNVPNEKKETEKLEVIEEDIDGDERGARILLFFNVERDKEEIPQYWYFTFGVGHYPNQKKYVKIFGTINETRKRMFDRFGGRWCMQYKNRYDFNPEKWGLTELIEEVD